MSIIELVWCKFFFIELVVLIQVVQDQLPLILMGLSAILFFSTYFLYFKKANKQFTEASIPYEHLGAELNKWGYWHWGRIIFESIAFIGSIIILIA